MATFFVLIGTSFPQGVPDVPTNEVTRGSAVWFSVALDCRPESQVVLLVDEASADGRPDGRVDRVFRLQAEPGTLPEGVADFAHDVVVRWGAERVEVLRAGEGVLELNMGGSDGREDGTVYSGFGLSRSTIGDGVTMPGDGAVEAGYGEFMASVPTLLLSNCDFYSCNAGGEGAITCSYGCGGTDCDVTCGDGWEPCCGCQDSEACCKCIQQV